VKKEYRDSSYCKEGNHDECPHLAGWGSSTTRLCHCSCHRDCPLRGDSVPTDVWIAQCTCKGSPALKAFMERTRPLLEARRLEREQVRAERNEKVRAAMDSVTTVPGTSESQTQEELARAFAEQGVAPRPGELELIAGSRRATASPLGLRTIRGLAVLGRFTGQLVRTVREATKDASTSSRPSDEENPPGP
jgi:hypothetical protein